MLTWKMGTAEERYFIDYDSSSWSNWPRCDTLGIKLTLF